MASWPMLPHDTAARVSVHPLKSRSASGTPVRGLKNAAMLHGYVAGLSTCSVVSKWSVQRISKAILFLKMWSPTCFSLFSSSDESCKIQNLEEHQQTARRSATLDCLTRACLRAHELVSNNNNIKQHSCHDHRHHRPPVPPTTATSNATSNDVDDTTAAKQRRRCLHASTVTDDR